MGFSEPEQPFFKVLYIEPDEIERHIRFKKLFHMFEELDFCTSKGACSVISDIKSYDPDILILSTNVIEPYLFLVLEYLAMEKRLPIIVVEGNAMYGREIIQSSYGKLLHLLFVPFGDDALLIRSVQDALVDVITSRVIAETLETGLAATLTLAKVLH